MMNNESFSESGMIFHFPKGTALPLDKQDFFFSLKNVKACDFISLLRLKKQKGLCFIEAKSSAPRKDESLSKYLDDLHHKYIHSLLLYIAILFNRTGSDSLNIPSSLNTADNLHRPVYFILVVRQHKREWLMTLQDKVNIALKDIAAAFTINGILVYNHEAAIKKGFVAEGTK